MAKKVLILLSGGLDSGLLIPYYQNKGREVHAIHVNYAQPWESEEDSARNLAKYYGVLMHYAPTAKLPVMAKSFVPMRNAHLLTIACAFAYVNNIPDVAMGCDRSEFLDQSAEFIDRFNFMNDYCFREQNHPWVLAPFATWTKVQLMKYAIKIKFPVEKSVSCLEMVNGKEACGTCVKCSLRRKYGYSY